MISKLSESAFSTTTGIVMPASRSAHPFVGECHGEKADPLVLEHAGYFVGAGAVTRGFVHDHDAYARIEQRPEIVEVVNHVVEIYLQYGRMRALFERMADFLEAERTAAF